MTLKPEQLSQEDVNGLLEVLLIHYKALNKIKPEQLGFIKRRMFQIHINKVNDLYKVLENKGK